MLLGVIEEAGGLESGASCFSATLETVALTSESAGKEQGADGSAHGSIGTRADR